MYHRTEPGRNFALAAAKRDGLDRRRAFRKIARRK
jgi:hypothetical protein